MPVVVAGQLREQYEIIIRHAERLDRDAPLRDGVRDTPARAAKAWGEMMRGYSMDVKLTTFPAESEGIVAMESLPFSSTCEHHLLPFEGWASFAYIPGDRMLGLSKFARLLEQYACRLQVQERLTCQLADCLDGVLSPAGVLVITEATHTCMTCRGVQRLGHKARMSEARGKMRESDSTKMEAMRLLGL